MELIGIELSDAGILAAGGDPAHVLEVDGGSVESPGYALQLKKELAVGHAADFTVVTLADHSQSLFGSRQVARLTL